jgi:hypothetical protein
MGTRGDDVLYKFRRRFMQDPISIRICLSVTDCCTVSWTGTWRRGQSLQVRTYRKQMYGGQSSADVECPAFSPRIGRPVRRRFGVPYNRGAYHQQGRRPSFPLVSEIALNRWWRGMEQRKMALECRTVAAEYIKYGIPNTDVILIAQWAIFEVFFLSFVSLRSGENWEARLPVATFLLSTLLTFWQSLQSFSEIISREGENFVLVVLLCDMQVKSTLHFVMT